MKVAIIGCGKIADQHLQAIGRIPGSEVVAACDRELLMARQLAERFGVGACFDDVDELLRQVRPDVVHITTPPQTHLDLATRCITGGSHVYIEKPFTLAATQARAVIECARQHHRLVTAGHNYQFIPEMMEMRQLVSDGLTGSPVHMESYWSYDLGDTSYVGPLLGNREHWVRRLPGQLLHNIISHGIARLAEFLSDDITDLSVLASQSPTMRQYGDMAVTDELRVLLRDSKDVTAEFCFSTQIKPGQNVFRLHGSKGSLTVDVSNGGLTRQVGKGDKSYLTFVLPHFRLARQYRRRALRNLWEIVRWRYYQDSGMTELIRRFHRACKEGGESPIPYREILLTAQLMDRIFDGVQARGKSSG